MQSEIKDTEMALTFADLSASAARNNLRALKARRAGKVIEAKLFNAIADSEKIQARRALVYLRGNIGNEVEETAHLLRSKEEAFLREYPELEKRYAEIGNRHASETFLRYGKVAKNHFKLLKNFDKQNLNSETVCHVCQVCGFIILDQHPEKCPVCNAVKKKVKKHE